MITIRNASIADAQGLIDLLNPIILGGKNSAMTQPFNLQNQQNFIAGFPKQGDFLVAEDSDNTIVGMQTIVPVYDFAPAFQHVCEIATFVLESAQHQGIGSLLMDKTKQQAQEKGFKKIIAMIRSDNISGLSYYKKHSFQQIGLAKNHALINGCFIDEVMTECWL